MEVLLILVLVSFAAGFIGVLTGVGGGIILIPVMVGILDIPVHLAIAASLVSVTANSLSGGSQFLRTGSVNIRLAILMSISALIATLTGVLLSKVVGGRVVTAIFALMILLTIWVMFKGRKDSFVDVKDSDPLALKLRLPSWYIPSTDGLKVEYGVLKVVPAIGIMAFAGLSAGLLGVGGGFIQVPVMDRVLKLPIKVSTATSNFMMGLSAAAAALAYLALGDLHPLIAGPTVVGIFLGSRVGAGVAPRIHSRHLRWLFLGLLLVMCAQMIVKVILWK